MGKQIHEDIGPITYIMKGNVSLAAITRDAHQADGQDQQNWEIGN
ncbi:hypothetical protein [Pseudomonas sp. KU43P]|nr:hypothetical protein [Pseudomonas sp. KU43P]